MNLRNILEGYPTGVLLLGEVFEECNEQACQLLQTERDAIIGHSLLDFSPQHQPDGRNSATAAQQYIKAARSGSPQIFQWQTFRKDGVLIDLEISLKTIELAEQQLILLSMRDGEELRLLEDQLHDYRNRYRTLTEVSPVGIFQTNHEGKFQYVNDRWCELTGFSDKEALKKGLALGIHPADQKRVLNEWRNAAEQGRPFRSEYRMVHTNGTIFWVYGQIAADKGENGEVRDYLGTITDITERKNIEEALEARNGFIEGIMVNLPLGLIVLSHEDFKIEYFNPKAEEIVGWPQEKLVDLNSFFEEAIPVPATRQQLRQKIRSDLESGDSARMGWEIPIIKGSGKRAELLVCAIPQRELKLVILTVQDITERKAAEGELRERNEFIETILNNLPIGLAVVTWGTHWSSRRIVFENRKMDEILGVSKGTFVSAEKFFEFAIPDSSRREELKNYSDILWNKKDSAIRTEEYEITKGTGEKAVLFWWNIPLVNEGLMIVTAQDITTQRRAQEEIQKLNRGLEERVVERTRELELANQEMEAFTYSVSHDLRAPLRAIDGFSEALLEDYADQLDEEGRNYLHYLQEGCSDMSKLIDGLLQLSRSSRGEILRVPVDLSSLVATVMAELHQAEPERQVDFQIEKNLKTYADSRLLKAVIENLLGNALKYTARTGEAHIEFGTEQQNGETVYFVRDNGAGFDMVYADKLFQPFQRLHRTDEFTGMGIGLATVQRIIHRHGGQVWAQAKVGKGATFYFTLGGKENTDQ